MIIMKIRKIAALTMAAMMALGSASTVMATTSAESIGDGTFEGGEIDYPAITVTVPTIAEGTYDYIADPNDLINNAGGKDDKYSGATFNGNTGVYFKTSGGETAVYDSTSIKTDFSNENAQDLDVTVKMEVATAGDENLSFADSATFEGTEQQIYLALTNTLAGSDLKTSALSDDAAATLTTEVAGTPDNYEPGWNSSETKYAYTKKSGELTWNKTSFAVTGAINKNSGTEWKEDIAVPQIKVTWSYKEHQDAYVSSTTVAAGTSPSLTLSLPTNVTVSSVKITKDDGTTVTATSGTHYTLSGTTLTLKNVNSAWSKITVTYSDGNSDEITVS